MVANILPAVIPHPGDGVNRLRFNFFRERESRIQQHGRKYFARIPPPQNPRDGTIGQNSTFSNMVMLHIKLNGITKCSNMVANILSADLPPPHSHTHIHSPLTGSIGQNSAFSEHGHVAYPIKWNQEMQQHGSNYFACRPSCP